LKRKLIALLFIHSALLAPLPTSRAQKPEAAPLPLTTRDSSQDSSGELPRGKLIEKVLVKNDPAQSYALYLPSNYTPQKRWPILYGFDPAARGSLPVERFRAAAERYGWIIAGSNNSRNGPLKPSLAATAAMWDDTHARLSVDSRRVYTTGFSGGARNAVRVGFLCRDCLAGVIACGAGFPVEIEPSASVPFPVFALAGTNDFNFPELTRLSELLDKFHVPQRFEVFDGGHEWPTAELCTEAVEWMEIQAMKSARRPRDEQLLDQLWTRRTTQARALEDARKPFAAYRIYRALSADFEGLRETNEQERREAQLRETKEVKRALEEENSQVRQQQRITGELVALLDKRQDPDEGAIAAVDFRRSIADLRKTARGAEDTGERRVARRVLHQMFARYYEGALNQRERRDNYALAAATLEIAAEIAADNPHVFYELACTYALNRERRKALEALKKAVEKGFDDPARLDAEEAFKSIQGDAAYKEILDTLKRKR
jgi:predicted esterase